jgi:hypothetical protein
MHSLANPRFPFCFVARRAYTFECFSHYPFRIRCKARAGAVEVVDGLLHALLAVYPSGFRDVRGLFGDPVRLFFCLELGECLGDYALTETQQKLGSDCRARVLLIAGKHTETSDRFPSLSGSDACC